MRKLLLVIVLLVYSGPVYSQATFPVTNKRIVDDLWCDLMATKLSADAKHWRNLVANATTETTNNRITADLANASTIYKNLCEGSVYLLIKGALKKVMPE